MDAIQYDTIMDLAVEGVMGLALSSASEGWYYSLWYATTDQEQDEMMAQWMEDIATLAAKTEAERIGMAGVVEEKSKDEEEEGEDEEGEEVEGEEDDEK